ncbi:protein kinase domain-containing protein [Sorangium sp. So ce117]|uniref:serine/threonine-protein kinase n=1 Tax=Sorangium sp. So ce117 TaxID=3133277 RepID=UPI003F6276AC
MSFVHGLSQGLIVLGRFRLDAELGHGGMSVVWGATNLATQRPVALKFLKRAAPHGSRARKRLAREARASVDHPNVVGVYDMLEIDDTTPVLHMELLRGRTLRSELREQGRLSLRRTADLLCPVVAAMGYVHECGFVHRDLKPENLFVLDGTAERPGIKVIDFGVVKLMRDDPDGVDANLTTEGAAIGTAGYAAPEQGLGNKDVDGRADVWSLGVVLYECLIGTRPLAGDSWNAYLEASLRRGAAAPPEVDALEVPPEIGALIDRMLAPRPEERPTLRQVFELLRAYSCEPDAPFSLPGVVPRPRRTSGGAGDATAPDSALSDSDTTTGGTTMSEELAAQRADAARPAPGRRKPAWRRGAVGSVLLAGSALVVLGRLSCHAADVPATVTTARFLPLRMPVLPVGSSKPAADQAMTAIPAPAAPLGTPRSRAGMTRMPVRAPERSKVNTDVRTTPEIPVASTATTNSGAPAAKIDEGDNATRQPPPDRPPEGTGESRPDAVQNPSAKSQDRVGKLIKKPPF